MDKKKRERLIEDIAGTVGLGVHTSLRKFCDSNAAMRAWDAISDMPDEEWDGVSTIVAEEILKIIEERTKKE